MLIPTLNHPSQWQHLLPKPHQHSHKYSRGFVMIQGGYPVTGAARLAAMSAARTGAGITTIAVPDIAFNIYASSCLSIMVKPYTGMEELHTLITDPRISAYLIGPGAGISTQTYQITLEMLASTKPVVIDADALSSLSNHVALLKKMTHGSCVLTPHEGEFARLFGIFAGDTFEKKLVNTQHAALESNSIVLLKGAQTIIASPDGRLVVNENAPAYLATAGAGDVLAGIIVSLLAQGMPAFEAATAAAWIHGAAANIFGLGLIAEDLPNLIPETIQSLLFPLGHQSI